MFDEDAGEYSAVAENAAGQAVSKCALTVQPTAEPGANATARMPNGANADAPRSSVLRPQLERPLSQTQAEPPAQSANARLVPTATATPFAAPTPAPFTPLAPVAATATAAARPAPFATAPTGDYPFANANALPYGEARPIAPFAAAPLAAAPASTTAAPVSDRRPVARPAAPAEATKKPKLSGGSPPTFTRVRRLVLFADNHVSSSSCVFSVLEPSHPVLKHVEPQVFSDEL